MARTYSFDVTVDADEERKRYALCQNLDIALSVSEVRVTSGTWRVTLEKLPAVKPVMEEKGKPVCPNCGQWQHPPKYDCMNECAKRGFAKYGQAPHSFAGGVVTPHLCVACGEPKEKHR